MARSALERFAHGAATAGANYFQNMTFLEIQSDLTKERDTYLANLRSAGREDTQAFTAQQNKLTREAQLTRDVKTEEFRAATLAKGASGAKATAEHRRQQLENEATRLGLLEDSAALKDELVELQLDKAKDQKTALNKLKGMPAGKERDEAVQWLNLLSGKTAPNVIIKQLQNKEGTLIDDFAIFNSKTGARIDEVAPAGGQEFSIVPILFRPAEKLAIKQQFRDGKISRAEALRRLEELDKDLE